MRSMSRRDICEMMWVGEMVRVVEEGAICTRSSVVASRGVAPLVPFTRTRDR